MKKTHKKWKAITCSCIRTINIASTHYQRNIESYAVLIKIPMAFLSRNRTEITRFVWYHKRPGISKAILRNRNKAVRNRNNPDFHLYYKTTITITVWYGHKKHIHRPTEYSEINPHKCRQIIFDKRAKHIHDEKASSINSIKQIGKPSTK